MTDIVDKETRSQMMAGIGSKNTRPELIVRKALFSLGYRFRVNVKSLPGSPDIVLPKYGAVVFVHGCFWHMHGCNSFKWPSTRSAFWRKKLMENHDRDLRAIDKLVLLGWRVMVVWECEIRRDGQASIEKLSLWIKNPV